MLLTPDQPLASIAGRVVALPAPPLRQRRWLVPVDFIGRALRSSPTSKITLRRPSHLVILGDLRVPRVQVRYDSRRAQDRARGSHGYASRGRHARTASTISQDGDQLL